MPSRAIQQRRAPTGGDLVAVPTGLASVARRQEGVVTRRQLAAAGRSPGQIESEVVARRWRAFGRNVLVLHNAGLSDRQREWVAVLLPDKPAALAGLSAAAASGLRGFEPDQVHVVVSHDTHVRMPPWVKLHESRRLRTTDIRSNDAPPRTPFPRSVIDAATWSRWPRRACAILCAAVQQRLVTAERLSAELRAAGRIRHVAIMRDILGDIAGGGHTLAEIDLGPIAVRAGLPPPRRQGPRREPNGKVRYVDAEFELPDGTILVVEIDGSVHLQPDSWWNDQDRQNEIVIARCPVLRYPSLTIRLEPGRVVDQLRRIRQTHAA